jgi:drug/metabolite transporter (DMT)-like permease
VASGAFGTRRAGLLLALISAVAFGGSGPVAKPLIDAGIDPLQVAFLRVAGAALVLSPLAVRHLGVLRHPTRIVSYGLFAVAGVQACYFAAISRIPVGVALLVEYFAPVLVLAFVRVVLRRRVSRAALIGVVFAVVGLANVVEVWSGARFDPLGLALALGAACCQVVYFVLSEGGGARPVSPTAMLSVGLLVGAAALTLVARPWTLPWHLLATAAPVRGVAVPAWLLVAWLAVVTTVLAYLTGIAAVRRLSAPVGSTVACLEAVLAALLAWLLLGQSMTAIQVAGGLLVLAGAVIAQRATPAAPAAPSIDRSDELIVKP